MKKSTIVILILTFSLSITFGQRSSIGIIINGGFGFESIPFFLDQYGNQVSLSTGSGFSIGGEYGYDFSRSFNIAATPMFQISKISKQAKNADGKFTRMAFLITPSLTFPARKDPIIKVRLGAGPGLYSFCSMKIDASEAGGEDMTLKYKTTVGFHSSLLFLIRIQRNGSIAIGGKYYNISYKYKREGSTHYYTIDDVNNPDGSGLGIIFGIYQFF
jgi:hypothetical protein